MDTTRIGNLHERYIALFGEEPSSTDVVRSIEASLDVVLPDDMKQISKFYSGGYLGGISHYAITISGPADNVVGETLRLRSSVRLPHRFLVLAEPPESLIVLDCESHESGTPAVIWCDAQDVRRLNNVAALSRPDTWQSYVEFFAHLLNQEELDRARKQS